MNDFKAKLAAGQLAIPFGKSAEQSRQKLENKPAAPIEHKVTGRVTVKSKGRKKPTKRGLYVRPRSALSSQVSAHDQAVLTVLLLVVWCVQYELL